MRKAVMMKKNDNVAVVIEPVEKGEMVSYTDMEGVTHNCAALSEIPIYHKIAVCNIKKGERVLKYGESIGITCCDIAEGEHVHVHNIGSSSTDCEVNTI